MDITEQKQYALYEAIADIALCAGSMKFITHNSRLVIEHIISWAKEFESINASTVWGVNTDLEYMEAIELFTELKIKEAVDNELGYIDN